MATSLPGAVTGRPLVPSDGFGGSAGADGALVGAVVLVPVERNVIMNSHNSEQTRFTDAEQSGGPDTLMSTLVTPN